MGLTAQTPARPPVFHVETALMQVEVQVTDRQGRPVEGLTKDDFTLTENGKPQRISFAEYIATPGQALPSPMGAPAPAPAPAPAGKAVEARSPAREPAYEQLRRSTLVYIASRGGREDRPVIYEAIRKFISEDLQPGVLVSLDGTPFTADKDALLAALDEKLHRGFGTDRTGQSLIDQATISAQQEDEYTGQFESLMQELNSEFSDSIESVNEQRTYYGYLTLYRYIDLIRALSIYPGRKIVVLFSRGFRIEEENLDLLDSFADEAMRARVRFYVADVRRLQALPPGGDVSQKVDFKTLLGNPDNNGFRKQIEKFQDEQDGLVDLAKQSGGRAVLNANDLGEIFEAVNESLSGYYLLGYYPRDTEQKGRFRRIRVTVSRPNVKLSYLRGYYEKKDYAKMTKAERELQLHQAVQFNTPYVDVPLLVGHEYFRADDGEPVLAYSVGIHSYDIPVKKAKQGVAMDFTIVARATPTDGDGPPAVDQQRFHMVLKPDWFQRFERNREAVLHYTSQMKLPAGTYDWRIVLRDENTGKIGSYRTTLHLPDFNEELSPSSLLLTGRIARIPAQSKSSARSARRKGKGKEAAVAGALDIGNIRFYPDSAHVFSQGDTVYLLYDLYNVGAGALKAPPSAKLALFRDKKRVRELPVDSYQVVPVPEENELRYTASLDTSKLTPGDYILMALLPRGQRPFTPFLYRKFRVVPPSGGQ